MAKIEYTTYKFNYPKLISEDEYNSLKELLTHNPNHNPFKGKLPNEILALVKMYLFGIPICALCGYLSDIIKIEWISGILILIVVMFGFGLFIGLFTTVLFTLSSYIKYNIKRKIYYNKLRKNITNSVDYHEFVKKFN